MFDFDRLLQLELLNQVVPILAGFFSSSPRWFHSCF
jgi:hypothetical protein